MSNKIIDLDPRKRLTKEALDAIKASVASYGADDLDCLFIASRSKTKGARIEVFGIDWDLLGFSQACLDSIRQRVLEDEIGVLDDLNGED